MFWASTAIVVVTWGIVPLQAGIFTTGPIQRAVETTFEQSTNFLAAGLQNTTLNGRYIYSTHGIIWLNETVIAGVIVL